MNIVNLKNLKNESPRIAHKNKTNSQSVSDVGEEQREENDDEEQLQFYRERPLPHVSWLGQLLVLFRLGERDHRRAGVAV